MDRVAQCFYLVLVFFCGGNLGFFCGRKKEVARNRAGVCDPPPVKIEDGPDTQVRGQGRLRRLRKQAGTFLRYIVRSKRERSKAGVFKSRQAVKEARRNVLQLRRLYFLGPETKILILTTEVK